MKVEGKRPVEGGKERYEIYWSSLVLDSLEHHVLSDSISRGNVPLYPIQTKGNADKTESLRIDKDVIKKTITVLIKFRFEYT